jgi:tetratricopeptide (TPR) repeat protein
MPSYFKRYYLDDVKLAQRALLEFHRSLLSGRMIAFTGAMTTEGAGYGTWDQLVETYARIASRVKEKKFGEADALEGLIAPAQFTHHAAIDKVLSYRGKPGEKNSYRFDVRVALGLMEEVVVGHDGANDDPLPRIETSAFELDRCHEPIDMLSIKLAHYFRHAYRTQTTRKGRNDLYHILGHSGDEPQEVVEALLHSLGIRRFATLNYDFELERQTMLRDRVNSVDPPDAFEALRALRIAGKDAFLWALDSGRIRRVLATGQAIESDILNRERIDRMIEFAVGADDVDQHIIHMHGRACDHKSMILSYRDYDRLYRRNDLYKLPFEFAQRVMIGGNPVLFVGLGMSEQEVNQSLQDFVSSSPYQRMAPTFLFWNLNRPRKDMTADDWREAEMLRLDRFHRLGVLTIFDADLPTPDDTEIKNCLIDLKGKPLKTQALASMPDTRRAAEIHNLRWLIEHSAAAAEKVASRENYTDATRFREMEEKVAITNGPVILWELSDGGSEKLDRDNLDRAVASIAEKLKAPQPPMLCVVGRQGRGHGSLAFNMANRSDEFGFLRENTLLINGSFSFDTDSLLDAVTRFISKRRDDAYSSGDARTPQMSRGDYFRSLADFTPMAGVAPLLIVINGMERFFSLDGGLLSAELDELFDIAAKGDMPSIRWLLFGSERVANYMDHRKVGILRGDDYRAHSITTSPDRADGDRLPFERLDMIRMAFDRKLKGPRAPALLAPAAYRVLREAVHSFRAHSSSRISGDSMAMRRAFYDMYLGNILDEALRAGGKDKQDIALVREILRALSFIGLPAEAAVLEHVPKIKQTGEPAPDIDHIEHLLKEMIDLGLVIAIKGYTDGVVGKPRYTLPRTLMSELRYRFSVPLTEAKLSTAFNMSLYIAQPADGFIPEPDIHDELGNLIDHLIGAYRDDARKGDPLKAEWRSPIDTILADIVPHERLPLDEVQVRRDGEETAVPLANQIDALCRVEHIQRLRAALALIRGYYTTTDLLTLDVGDRLIREDRDGILLEHAERLDCLIDAYGKVAMARDRLRAVEPQKGGMAQEYGMVEPLYADELVWLHNERGVVRLAMGDLPEAAASFDRAFDVNRRHVERDDRAHNWRRIRLNQLTIDIEAGEISLCLRKIEEILAISRRRDFVPAKTAQDLAPQDDKVVDDEEDIADDVDHCGGRLREDRLAIAIARGYRARARHLQGDTHRAEIDYDFAIRELAALEETRGQAYFLRLRAEISPEHRDEDIVAALRLARSTRQMDIVYRLNIMTAIVNLTSDAQDGKVDRAGAQQMLDNAMRYALQTDMHRIRVEAGAALAETRLKSGDYEGALRNVSDALMVATRFGMELRKILLRSLMARIMVKRGHPITASKLALTTIKIASRRKFQLAIEHAEETLLGIPHVSVITDVIDASMRRQI